MKQLKRYFWAIVLSAITMMVIGVIGVSINKDIDFLNGWISACVFFMVSYKNLTYE